MPIGRYRNAMKGDYTQLRKKENEGSEKMDLVAMDMLEDDFYEKIGFGEKFHKLHKLKNQKALLEADYVINDKRFNLNLIKIKQQEINDLESQMNSGTDIDSAKVMLDKWLGYSINMATETTLDFYKKLEQYGRVK